MNGPQRHAVIDETLSRTKDCTTWIRRQMRVYRTPTNNTIDWPPVRDTTYVPAAYCVTMRTRWNILCGLKNVHTMCGHARGDARMRARPL